MPLVKKATESEDRVHRSSELYKDAFASDPVITYMLANLSKEARKNYMYTYFRALMTASALNGGIFEEAEDYASCSVIIPPGKDVGNTWTLLPAGILGVLWKIGFQGCRRMLSEYEPMTEAVRHKALAGEKRFYYVFFIATREDSRRKGLSSALTQSAQRKATDASVPVWLEATTEYLWKIYQRLGFETVDSIVLGKGHAAPDGSELKGGEGVLVRCMIWCPPKGS